MSRLLQMFGALVFIGAVSAGDGRPNILNSVGLLGLAVAGASLVVLMQALVIRAHLRKAVSKEAEDLVAQHRDVCRAELDVRLADVEKDLAVLGDLERTVVRLEECSKNLKEAYHRQGGPGPKQDA